MTVLKAINVNPDVFKEFRKISIEEGKTVGKMLEILIEAYKKQQEVKEDGQVLANQKQC